MVFMACGTGAGTSEMKDPVKKRRWSDTVKLSFAGVLAAVLVAGMSPGAQATVDESPPRTHGEEVVWIGTQAAAGTIPVRGQQKVKVVRDLDLDSPASCFSVNRSRQDGRWVQVYFNKKAGERWPVCNVGDYMIYAKKRDGRFVLASYDNFRNSCKNAELDLYRAGAPRHVVRDLLSWKGCPR